VVGILYSNTEGRAVVGALAGERAAWLINVVKNCGIPRSDNEYYIQCQQLLM